MLDKSVKILYQVNTNFMMGLHKLFNTFLGNVSKST